MTAPCYHEIFSCTGPMGERAPELVLLHGWALNGTVFEPLLPALQQYFRITLMDLPGMGRSAVPDGDYSLSWLAASVLKQCPPIFSVLGWSLGGMVAMRMAMDQPQRVQKLVTVASSPSFVQQDSVQPDAVQQECDADKESDADMAAWPYAMPPETLAQFIHFYDQDSAAAIKRFLALQCMGSVMQKEDQRFLQSVLHTGVPVSSKALRAGLQLLAQEDLRADLQRLRVPVLHVLGENDALLPASALADMVSLSRSMSPDAQAVLLSQCSHMPFYSGADALLAAVLPFLR